MFNFVFLVDFYNFNISEIKTCSMSKKNKMMIIKQQQFHFGNTDFLFNFSKWCDDQHEQKHPQFHFSHRIDKTVNASQLTTFNRRVSERLIETIIWREDMDWICGYTWSHLVYHRVS